MSLPMFTTGKDGWATPSEVFDPLHAEFGFTLDVAANELNRKVSRWLGPGSPISEDGLFVSWRGEVCWMNPPYSRGLQERFIEKAATEARSGTTVVAIVPARPDTRTFHRFIWNTRTNEPHKWVRSLRFVKGRVKFINPDGPLLRGTKMNGGNNSAPFPSMVVVFGSSGDVQEATPLTAATPNGQQQSIF